MRAIKVSSPTDLRFQLLRQPGDVVESALCLQSGGSDSFRTSEQVTSTI